MPRKRRPAALAAVILLAAAVLAWAYNASVLAAIILTVLLLYVAVVVVAGAGLAGLSAIVYLTLPRARKTHYRSHKIRLALVVLVSVVFCGAAALMTNAMFLPGRLEPVSLSADALILVFSIVSGWVILACKRRPAILVTSTVVFVVALGVIIIMASTTTPAKTGPSLKKLAALPYATWTPVENPSDSSGVVYYDEERAYPGINIYNPRNLPTAYLMDMSGKIFHSWSAKIDDDDSWVYAEMLPNGDLIAIVDEKRLVRLDWDSNVIWAKDIRVHHDFAFGDNGEMVILTMSPHYFRVRGIPILAIDEQITFLSGTREVTKQISFSDILRGRIPADRYLKQYLWLAYPPNLIRIAGARGSNYDVQHETTDLFHSNTVEIIDRDINNAFRKGNILFCARNLHLIGVLDPDTEEILWTWGPGRLDRPHHPTLLGNGHILIYDNGTHRGYSRIVVMDPSTGRIVWQYRSDPPEDFYSATRGGNQRLPNGNTLITCSDKGSAFEVTEDGEIVWEFLNTEIDSNRRAAIYRFMRITNPEDYPCLQGLGG